MHCSTNVLKLICFFFGTTTKSTLAALCDESVDDLDESSVLVLVVVVVIVGVRVRGRGRVVVLVVLVEESLHEKSLEERVAALAEASHSTCKRE